MWRNICFGGMWWNVDTSEFCQNLVLSYCKGDFWMEHTMWGLQLIRFCWYTTATNICPAETKPISLCCSDLQCSLLSSPQFGGLIKVILTEDLSTSPHGFRQLTRQNLLIPWMVYTYHLCGIHCVYNICIDGTSTMVEYRYHIIYVLYRYHLSIYLSINQSIYLSIHLSIYLSIYYIFHICICTIFIHDLGGYGGHQAGLETVQVYATCKESVTAWKRVVVWLLWGVLMGNHWGNIPGCNEKIIYRWEYGLSGKYIYIYVHNVAIGLTLRLFSIYPGK